MDTVLTIINFIGIISFAAAGAMVAIDHETDLFGVALISIITAFGGGLLRDVIAGQTIGRELPLLFTSLDLEIIVCIMTALGVFVAASVLKKKYVEEEATVNKINNVLDALGLGVFCSAGTGDFLVAGPLVAITMGVLSSVGGSLTRDIILGDVPMILRKRVYAIACIAGSSVYYVLAALVLRGMDSETASVISTISCIAVIFAIRMCATHYKWNIPRAIIFSELREEENERETADK